MKLPFNRPSNAFISSQKYMKRVMQGTEKKKISIYLKKKKQKQKQNKGQK